MERNISSACSMLSHVHDGAGNLLHTVSRHLCTRIGLQLTFTGSLKSTQIRNIATKDPSLHDYNLDRPLLCIYQSRASCYSCKDPIAAALSELTETRQLIFNYAWAVFVWVVGEVWFWVSNCLHFSLCPWSWLWGETSTQMAMRMPDLEIAIDLLGNLKRTPVAVVYLDLHTSTGIYLSNLILPLSTSLKWT